MWTTNTDKVKLLHEIFLPKEDLEPGRGAVAGKP